MLIEEVHCYKKKTYAGNINLISSPFIYYIAKQDSDMTGTISKDNRICKFSIGIRNTNDSRKYKSGMNTLSAGSEFCSN